MNNILDGIYIMTCHSHGIRSTVVPDYGHSGTSVNGILALFGYILPQIRTLTSQSYKDIES